MFPTIFGPQIPQTDPAGAKAKLEQANKPYLLDVRQPDEFKDGHIAGATLIPLGELRLRENELPRDREIIVVCHSGNRSGTATRYLNSVGFRATNLMGGMLQWSRAGLPVKKGPAK